MKFFKRLAATCAGVLALSGSANADSTSVIVPTIRYVFNNQIDQGGYVGFSVLKYENCRSSRVVRVQYVKCDASIWGPLLNFQFGSSGLGYGLGVNVNSTEFRYSVLNADPDAKFKSSDRLSISFNFTLLHFEIGVKQEHGDGHVMPSFGVGIGL